MIGIVVIVGPTASGKSALALELARRYGGEIVSCDSMQLYRGMDIGTAKPNVAERALVPHHMLDVADPRERYSCADYARDAGAAVRNIAARAALPVVCGGTGLYLDALLLGSGTAEMTADPEYRAVLQQTAAAPGGKEILYTMLTEADPAAAETIHPNNVKRTIRALEINHAAGMSKADWDKRSTAREAEFDPLFIGLNYRSRENLYRRIDARVEQMLASGLVGEARRLLETGRLAPENTAAQAIGYKELLPYLHGECELEQAAEELKRATRRYAKRQLTWFARNPTIHWIYPDDSPAYGIDGDRTFEDIVNIAEKLFINRGFCSIIKK